MPLFGKLIKEVEMVEAQNRLTLFTQEFAVIILFNSTRINFWFGQTIIDLDKQNKFDIKCPQSNYLGQRVGISINCGALKKFIRKNIDTKLD